MTDIKKQNIQTLTQKMIEIQTLLAQGEFEKADKQAEFFLDIPGVMNAAKSMQALARVSMERNDEAAKLLNELPGPGEIKQYEVALNAGTCWMHLNAPRRAIDYLKAVLELKPDHPLANARLGATYVAIDRPSRAIPFLEKAHELMPESIGNRANLARALLDQGQAERALSLLPELSDAQGDDYELYSMARSEALLAMEKGEEAQEQLSQLAKSSSEANMLRIVRLHQSRGQFDEAQDALEEALKRYPESQRLFLIASDLAELRGRFVEAARWLRRALGLKPDSASLWARLALLSGRRFADENAQEAAEKALALTESFEPVSAERLLALVAKAHVLKEMDKIDEAVKLYEQILEVDPDHQRAIGGYGQVLMQLGKVSEAVALYERLKTNSPVAAWSHLIHARQLPDDPTVLEEIEAAARRPSLEGPVKTNLLFTLASAYEKTGEYEKAWGFATEANNATKQLLGYSAEEHRDKVEREIARFSKAFMESRADFGSDSEVPTFVLGMPRSGTTLLEQILGSHSAVFAAGELSLIPQQIQKLEGWERKLGSGRHYPECVDDMTREESIQFAAKILSELQGYDESAARVVDKLPHNFEHVGLIKLLFPKAKILHLKRDPRAVAISNYFIDYGAKFGGMGFAYDLESIGEQLADHERYMAHWHELFGEDILDVEYESLVEDVERWARKIIAFLNLDWEDSVLAFQDLDRQVKTASVWQVRQPVYKSSKQKWRNYEKFLGPIGEKLAEVFPSIEFQEVSSEEPGNFLKGMTALQNADYAEAQKMFERLLEQAPDHRAAMHFLGAALYSQGAVDDAKNWILKSLDGALQHRSWLENLAKVEEFLGDKDQADAIRARLRAPDLTQVVSPSAQDATTVVAQTQLH